MEPALNHPSNEAQWIKVVIQDWDLDDLLRLQIDLTRIIQRRVSALRKLEAVLECEKEVPKIKTESVIPEQDKVTESKVRNGFKRQGNFDLGSSQISGLQYLKDGERLKAGTTQIESSQPEPQDEFSIPGTLDMQSKEIDFSSPLKPGGQADSKQQKSSPIKRQLAIISDSEGDIDWSDSEDHAAHDVSGKKQRIEPPSFNLNTNPITNKPWIFEDFKVNDLFKPYDRGRTNHELAKISKFHAIVGQPASHEKLVLHPDRGFEMVKENQPHVNQQVDSIPQFDNLRQRSKSPPGFGRLDFPSTQENLVDQKKAREILANKTKARFLIATRSDIPAKNRQYLFKNSALNDAVDAGDIQWDEDHLTIFSRARVRN